MSLTNLAKFLIPEGTVRELLRCVRHNLRKGETKIEYFPLVDRHKLTFRFGPLKGYSVLFQDSSLWDLSAVQNDLPGYFSPKFIGEDSVVIDAGAFPGDFSLIAAKIAKKGRVLALEPQAENRKKLETNIALNGYSGKITILPYALSDVNSNFSISSNGSGSSIIQFDQTRPLSQSRTIDTILQETNISPESDLVIKMDIEGAELKAVLGAEEAIRRGAKFMIAAYHLVNREPTICPLTIFFRDKGYHVKWCNQRHLTLAAAPYVF